MPKIRLAILGVGLFLLVVIAGAILAYTPAGCENDGMYPPQSNTCVEITILKNDFPNTDGSYGYTIFITSVDTLPPYKMMHVVGPALSIAYRLVPGTIERAREAVLADSPNHQIFVVNMFGD